MTPTIARALTGQLNLPTDCDCDNDDCVRCAHYPTIVENAQKELRDAAPDLLAGYLAATEENELLRHEIAEWQEIANKWKAEYNWAKERLERLIETVDHNLSKEPKP